MSLTKAVEPWAIEPVERFVAEVGARFTLLMTPAGQVLAQYGFTRAVDVMAAAALGAAIVSSTAEITKMVEQSSFRVLNHQGSRHGIFLGGLTSPRGPLLVLVVYGTDSSIGIVQLFFEEFARELASACPDQTPSKPVLAADFERELNKSLATLFGG